MADRNYTEWVHINSSTPTFTSELIIGNGERIAFCTKTGLSFVSGATVSLCSCQIAVYRKLPGHDFFSSGIDTPWSVADSNGETQEYLLSGTEEIESTIIKIGVNDGMDMYVDRTGYASSKFSSGNARIRIGRGY